MLYCYTNLPIEKWIDQFSKTKERKANMLMYFWADVSRCQRTTRAFLVVNLLNFDPDSALEYLRVGIIKPQGLHCLGDPHKAMATQEVHQGDLYYQQSIPG